MGFVASLFSGIGLKILTGLAIAGAVLAILAGARNAGRQAERVEGMVQTLKTVGVRNEIERDVYRLSGPAAVDRLLDKWSRD